jgi:hypothetical protein
MMPMDNSGILIWRNPYMTPTPNPSKLTAKARRINETMGSMLPLLSAFLVSICWLFEEKLSP